MWIIFNVLLASFSTLSCNILNKFIYLFICFLIDSISKFVYSYFSFLLTMFNEFLFFSLIKLHYFYTIYLFMYSFIFSQTLSNLSVIMSNFYYFIHRYLTILYFYCLLPYHAILIHLFWHGHHFQIPRIDPYVKMKDLITVLSLFSFFRVAPRSFYQFSHRPIPVLIIFTLIHFKYSTSGSQFPVPCRISYRSP